MERTPTLTPAGRLASPHPRWLASRTAVSPPPPVVVAHTTRLFVGWDFWIPGLRDTGSLVVEPFTLPGAGRGCYIIDPAGVLTGRTPTTRGRKVDDGSP
jgi:hypothetical protein